MKQLCITVVTHSGQQQIHVSSDQQHLRLSEILRRNALSLNTRCGGRGLCDGCLVQLTKGQVRHHSGEQTSPLPVPAPTTIRACEHELSGQDIELSVLARSMLAYEPQIVSNFRVNVSRSHDPIWQAVQLTGSDINGEANALSIARALASKLDESTVLLDSGLAAEIAEALAAGHAVVSTELLETGWTATALLPYAPESPIGVAIDIGTTTVAILIVELASGKVVGTASGFNRQMHLGDDVLTRINLCTTDKAMMGRLQAAIVKDTIERLLLKAMKEANITDDRIACLNIAGNTTMLHLLAGVDPSPLGFAPFVAPFLHHKICAASDLHLHLSSPSDAPRNGGSPVSEDPNLHLLPSAAAYVGADITAGVVSSGLAYDDGPSLLVDVGTNGEIVFKSGQRIWGTATAAGPAFEGSRMAGGMRAGQGAVSHIRMEMTPSGLQVHTEVIGNVKPTGICGSAYVDFLAQAAKVGLIGPSGRFVDGVADDQIAPYRDMGKSFTVALGHGHERIVISEGDIASLLQAKAAIAAGILTLMRRVGVEAGQIKTLYLAGGFGMHLDIANTIACGLLPGFRPEQVQLVGNTSLAGAYLSMLDRGLLDEIKRVAKAIEMVELNLDPEFEDCYIDQLMLPEPVEM
jgi:uncharacterized 2Fe-2S/4Fe-4S cluster protein (DUF4445 family)